MTYNKTLYHVKFIWYNAYDDEIIQHGFMAANNYTEVVAALEQDYSNIYDISIHPISCEGDCCGIIYVPNDDELIGKIVDENDY